MTCILEETVEVVVVGDDFAVVDIDVVDVVADVVADENEVVDGIVDGLNIEDVRHSPICDDEEFILVS